MLPQNSNSFSSLLELCAFHFLTLLNTYSQVLSVLQNFVLRDHGLTLLLVGVSALLLWRSALPQMEENRDLEREHRALTEEIRGLEADLDAYEALDRANSDPLVMERFARLYFGSLGLPRDETLVDPDAGGDWEGAPPLLTE